MYLTHFVLPWLYHACPVLYTARGRKKGLWYEGTVPNKHGRCYCTGYRKGTKIHESAHFTDFWYGGVFAYLDNKSFAIVDIAKYGRHEVGKIPYRTIDPCDPEFLDKVVDAFHEFVIWANLIIPVNGGWWWATEGDL